MRKWLATVAVVAVSFVSLKADVTVVQTITVEGPAAAAMGGGQMPQITIRIKGQKSRSDVVMPGQTFSSILDVAARQVIVLDAATKTAMVTTPASAAADGAQLPANIALSFTPTGKAQTIDGQQCDEHAFKMSLSMADFAGQGQAPPEAAAMMKDVRMVMNGSVWIARSAPGAAEFAAYNKAALASNMLGALTGLTAGKSGPIDKLMEAWAAAPGLPYSTEITMTFEGSGPMVEAMKQMGPMKMVQKIASVSTDTIVDDMFAIPEGYTVEKR